MRVYKSAHGRAPMLDPFWWDNIGHPQSCPLALDQTLTSLRV
jgi:hypothetical protein